MSVAGSRRRLIPDARHILVHLLNSPIPLISTPHSQPSKGKKIRLHFKFLSFHTKFVNFSFQ